RLARARRDRILNEWRAYIERRERRLVRDAERLFPRMIEELDAALADHADAFEWPDPAEGDDDESALYDSQRDYVEQVDIFRAHRGKDDDVGLAADREVTKTCQHCGVEFTAAGHNAKKTKFCSTKCSKRANYKREAAAKAGAKAQEKA